MRVSLITDEQLKDDFFSKNERCIRMAVFTDCFGQGYTNSVLGNWNALCRKQGIQMIVADQVGVFSRIVTDFGPNHKIIDKNGEEAQEVMLRVIEPLVVPSK